MHLRLLLMGFTAIALCGTQVRAQVPGAITFLRDAALRPSAQGQERARESAPWSTFLHAHPGWVAEFDERTGFPLRAFGPPITTTGPDPLSRATSFLQRCMPLWHLPADAFVHVATITGGRITHVHFQQQHQGIPVLRARFTVKLDALGRVLAWNAGPLVPVHDIPPAVIVPGQALELALADMGTHAQATYEGQALLPVPLEDVHDIRLVHRVFVEYVQQGRPHRWDCLVDAGNGALVYRADRVEDHVHPTAADHEMGAEVTVTATVRPYGPGAPNEVRGLPNLRVSVNGAFLFTDEDGLLATGLPGPVAAQAQLRGRWVNVSTNGTTPSLDVNLQEGANTLSFDGVSTLRERTTYHAVNRIHAHLKTIMPEHTAMDLVLSARIDVAGGNCNGFYDGSSISFYAAGNGCRSFAELPDVVYHEYAHGINATYYQGFGASLANGAISEGYADLWAMSLTGDPFLGRGFRSTEPASFLRRYDQGQRVYPNDLVGQVHADGQIIAGAWWSTAELLGGIPPMMALFKSSLAGLQGQAFNGDEGAAFRDVLLDALLADDDDANLLNGTPNGNAIVEAFARHGITLLATTSIDHQPVLSAMPGVPIALEALVQVPFPFGNYLQGVQVLYRLNGDADWSSATMSGTSWGWYTGTIPPQPPGTLVSYALAVHDVFGARGATAPAGAANEEPALPYFVTVGFAPQRVEDSDQRHEWGPWSVGLATDNATSGTWVQAVPVASFSGTSGTGVMVQPGTQTTPGGIACFVTGNASSIAAPMGEADVDGGVTTLLGPVMDLTDLTEPLVTYQRWYVNNPPGGTNPREDHWQVEVSADNGASWVPVDGTRVSARAWRRAAFRVRDLVPLTSQFRIRFMASDSVRTGAAYNGGSIVEAAVDDITLWDIAEITTGLELRDPSALRVFPVPASDRVKVGLTHLDGSVVRVQCLDHAGRVVVERTEVVANGSVWIDVEQLPSGSYTLKVQAGQAPLSGRFVVLRER